MDTARLVSAYMAWDKWCKARKKHFRGTEGRAESARLVAELVSAADQLGTTHIKLRETIVSLIAQDMSIPDAIEAATRM